MSVEVLAVGTQEGRIHMHPTLTFDVPQATVPNSTLARSSERADDSQANSPQTIHTVPAVISKPRLPIGLRHRPSQAQLKP